MELFRVLSAILSPADLAALALFSVLWLGYGQIVRLTGPTAINAGLGAVRGWWMRSMVGRDNRIVDSALIGHVMSSASFFASTSLLAVGALLGLLTGLDRLEPALALFGGVPAPRALLELKVLLPAVVLAHGVFLLTWALRQLNYTVALIGAVPAPPVAGGDALADALAGVLSSALTTFNSGIRSYYFALASLTWMAGPLVLAVTTLALMAVLLHRQRFGDVSRKFARAKALMEQAHRND
jgi:uncharacterized membrane protein